MYTTNTYVLTYTHVYDSSIVRCTCTWAKKKDREREGQRENEESGSITSRRRNPKAITGLSSPFGGSWSLEARGGGGGGEGGVGSGSGSGRHCIHSSVVYK